MKMTENKSEKDPEDGDDDHEQIMDQVARECMDAFEKKDKEQLLECLHVLVADILDKLSTHKEE